MKTFQTYVKEWEDNAKKDPYGAILTKIENGDWNRSEFFDAGKKEIELIKEYIQKKNIPIPLQGAALDFGCGIGRVSRALSSYFSQVVGVDISSTMINKAQTDLIPSNSKLKFVHNPRPDLSIFSKEQFDFIYSNIVLQHILNKH